MLTIARRTARGPGGSESCHGQQVYQFKTSRVAAGFYSALRAIVHRCPRFAFIGISGFKLGFKLVFTVAGQDLFFTGNIGVLTAPPTSPPPRTTMLRLIHRVSAFR